MARVKLKRIEASICSISNIKLSTPIFGLPLLYTSEINSCTFLLRLRGLNGHLLHCLYFELKRALLHNDTGAKAITEMHVSALGKKTC